MTKKQRQAAKRPAMQRETWANPRYDNARRSADPAKKKARKARQATRRKQRR